MAKKNPETPPEVQEQETPDFDAFEKELLSDYGTHTNISDAAPETDWEKVFEQPTEPKTDEPGTSKEKPLSVDPVPPNTSDLNRNFAELLRPDLCLIIFDMLMSFVCFAVCTKLLKVECSKDEFSLTPKEAEQLEPIVAEVLKTIQFNLTPGKMLLLATLIIYGSKVGIKKFLDSSGSNKNVNEVSNAKTAKVHKTSKRTPAANSGVNGGARPGAGRHKKDCQCEKCLSKKGGLK